MKISMVRFKFMLGVIFLILFFLLHPAGNLRAQEPITLPDGYKGMYYAYQFKAPKCSLNPVWEKVDKLPPGLSLNKSGLLFGKPEKVDERGFNFKVKLTFKTCNSCKNGLESKQSTYIVTLKVKKFPRWSAKENYRAICGFEYSGASSADSYQKLFFDLYISTPFSMNIKRTNKKYPRLGPPLTIWGNIKFTSLPRQVNTSLVKVPDEFLKVIKKMDINEIARGIEFSVGFDWRLFNLCLSSGKILSMSFIGAYGGSNPSNPDDTEAIYKLPNLDEYEDEYYEVIEELKNRYGTDITGKKYVAFVNADRKKLFRQLFLGFRLKTYTKPKPIIEKKNREVIVKGFEFLFPAVFEVTLGHNELIVNNDLYEFTWLRKDKKKLLVLSLGGILPVRLARSLNLYVFGKAMLHFNKGINRYNPLILEPVIDDDNGTDDGTGTGEVLLSDANVGRIAFFDEARDYYRFGIGIELSSALTGVVKKIVHLLSNPK